MNTSLLKYKKGIIYAILLFLAFFSIDYLEKHPIYCESYTVFWRNIVLLHKTPALLAAIYFFIIWVIYQSFSHVKNIFHEFIFPLAIVLFTLLSGTYGFLKIDSFNFGDAFFASANLLTLNTSVFKSVLSEQEKVNYWIENARISGGIFLAYAFFLALSIATGKENISRIKFWWYRLSFRQKTFDIVIGDSNKAVVLAMDIEKKGKKVVFLNQGFSEVVEAILDEKKIWYFKGNASSKASLMKTYFHLAENVYVLNESDEENFRTIQEMAEIIESNKHETIAPWFVHLSNLRQKSLLTKFVEPRYVQTFDISQNTARRLLKKHPIDHFTDGATVAQIIIIGFGDFAQAITRQCLQIGHYTGSKILQIKVYYASEEKEKVESFKKSHPELFKFQGVFGSVADAQLVQYYTFFQHCDSIIDFEPLPIAESDIVSPSFSLYDFINAENCTSIYACLSSGLESASFLGTVLPRIAWQKNLNEQKCEVQAFCHYNFPDLEEEKVVQKKLNEITGNHVKVFCFGNYLDECTTRAIENQEADFLAKQIALLYDKVHGNNNSARIKHTKEILLNWNLTDLDKTWKEIKEIDRESNRQAADHAWVKFREFGKNPHNLPENLENYWGNDLPILAELEHRRWNAEKLLLGWLPTSEETLWNNGHKNALRSQKLHYHLMDFETLPDDQKDKDYTQVMGLPYFMKEKEIISTRAK